MDNNGVGMAPKPIMGWVDDLGVDANPEWLSVGVLGDGCAAWKVAERPHALLTGSGVNERDMMLRRFVRHARATDGWHVMVLDSRVDNTGFDWDYLRRDITGPRVLRGRDEIGHNLMYIIGEAARRGRQGVGAKRLPKVLVVVDGVPDGEEFLHGLSALARYPNTVGVHMVVSTSDHDHPLDVAMRGRAFRVFTGVVPSTRLLTSSAGWIQGAAPLPGTLGFGDVVVEPRQGEMGGVTGVFWAPEN